MAPGERHDCGSCLAADASPLPGGANLPAAPARQSVSNLLAPGCRYRGDRGLPQPQGYRSGPA
jgi:hypothetical protein